MQNKCLGILPFWLIKNKLVQAAVFLCLLPSNSWCSEVVNSINKSANMMNMLGYIVHCLCICVRFCDCTCVAVCICIHVCLFMCLLHPPGCHALVRGSLSVVSAEPWVRPVGTSPASLLSLPRFHTRPILCTSASPVLMGRWRVVNTAVEKLTNTCVKVIRPWEKERACDCVCIYVCVCMRVHPGVTFFFLLTHGCSCCCCLLMALPKSTDELLKNTLHTDRAEGA